MLWVLSHSFVLWYHSDNEHLSETVSENGTYPDGWNPDGIHLICVWQHLKLSDICLIMSDVVWRRLKISDVLSDIHMIFSWNRFRCYLNAIWKHQMQLKLKSAAGDVTLPCWCYLICSWIAAESISDSVWMMDENISCNWKWFQLQLMPVSSLLIHLIYIDQMNLN